MSPNLLERLIARDLPAAQRRVTSVALAQSSRGDGSTAAFGGGG